MAGVLHPVTIRLAHEGDLAALARLSERDSRPLPDGRLLVAERNGVIDAVLSLDTGQAVADPFERTAELVGLLRAHAAAGNNRPRRRPPWPLPPRLIGRPA